MESNIIYKIFLRESALNQATQNYDAPIKNIFEKINPFQLFNILGKNNLFIFGILLLILYSWFIRANISLGAIFGFLFLGFNSLLDRFANTLNGNESKRMILKSSQ